MVPRLTCSLTFRPPELGSRSSITASPATSPSPPSTSTPSDQHPAATHILDRCTLQAVPRRSESAASLSCTLADIDCYQSPHLPAMAATTGAPVTLDTPIIIKVVFRGQTRKLKLPLKDLGANVLPEKVRCASSELPDDQAAASLRPVAQARRSSNIGHCMILILSV